MNSWIVALLLASALSISTAQKDKPGECTRRFFIALPCGPGETVRSCRSDGDCSGTKKCCQTDRCVTECEEPAAPKPGECPNPSLVEASRFSHCDVDTDCGENNDRKCCKNASGNRRCSNPRPKDKPGQCVRRFFIALACEPGEIVRTCHSDGDCSGTRKCCQTGPCATECEEPAAPKPGSCPLPHQVESGKFSVCEMDTDCGERNDRKCCANAGGITSCVRPRRTLIYWP